MILLQNTISTAEWMAFFRLILDIEVNRDSLKKMNTLDISAQQGLFRLPFQTLSILEVKTNASILQSSYTLKSI